MSEFIVKGAWRNGEIHERQLEDAGPPYRLSEKKSSTDSHKKRTGVSHGILCYIYSNDKLNC